MAGKTSFPQGDPAPDLKALIKLCLTVSSLDRPSCEEVLQHEWCQVGSPTDLALTTEALHVKDTQVLTQFVPEAPSKNGIGMGLEWG